MISLLTAESYQGRGANATGIYSTTVLISTSNTAEAGDKTITLRMTDEAGNETTDSTAVSIRLEGDTSFTIALHAGVNLVHVPVKVEGIDRVSDLYEALGGREDVGLIVMLDDADEFVAFTSDVLPGGPTDVALVDASGAIVVMKTSKTVTFSGAY